MPLPLDPELSPRAAAEELGYTFLPCILVGLSNAPQFILPTPNYTPAPEDIWAEGVDAVVVPANACGECYSELQQQESKHYRRL